MIEVMSPTPSAAEMLNVICISPEPIPACVGVDGRYSGGVAGGQRQSDADSHERQRNRHLRNREGGCAAAGFSGHQHGGRVVPGEGPPELR